jgi:hypothetical protein
LFVGFGKNWVVVKRFLFVLFLLAAFGGGYSIARMRLGLAQRAFVPNQYPALNRPFVVVIVGRNNGAFLDKTIGSVVQQRYENYRIVYVDDGSDDGSLELARDLLFESGRKMEVVTNEEARGVVANLAQVVQDCKNDEIVVVVGGEDWLAHEWVLSTLNQYYANADLWITYGQSCEYPQYTIDRVKAPGRNKPFTPLPLCSFYAGLFKQMGVGELADLEMAYMLPMLEMGEGHSTYVPEVLYVLNRKEEILPESEKAVREVAAYEPIVQWGGL